MHQPNWRPHQQGGSENDWTPDDWDAFAAAENMFSWKKKKNRGHKRKQWWTDKKAGLVPREEREKRQRAEQQNEPGGQNPPSANNADAAGSAVPSAVSAAQAAQAAALAPSAVSAAVRPPMAVAPWHVVAKARPRGNNVQMDHYRPAIVNPRPLGPAGNSPGFMMQFQHNTNIFVPHDLMMNILNNLPRGGRFQHMNNLLGVQGPPIRTHFYSNPPVYDVDDESEDEVVDTSRFPIAEDPHDPPDTGGSSSSWEQQ